MKREAIYKALFSLLQDKIDSVTTFERVLAHWDDVSPAMQPALFMTQGTQSASQATGLPTKYTLNAKLWLYTHRDTSNEIPSVTINNILDELDAAIAPPVGPSFKQTLGGLVEHCWISGDIETDEGTLGVQSVAIVPISMLVVA
jgi:hypothetical protein